jgi:competence protein ComEA
MTAGGIIALLSACFLLWRLGAEPSPAEAVAAEALAAKGPPQRHTGGAGASARMVMVYVSGAVTNPGLYRLPASLRIGDALAAAGGLLPDADPDRLPNLAGRLSDGKQVKVARLKASTSRSGAPAKVDINSADAATLASVPGVDPALAQAIVDYRNGYGPFASVAELKTALGLDASTLGAIRRYLTAY